MTFPSSAVFPSRQFFLVHHVSFPSPSMDRCSIELWTTIVGHACTDGGYTGSSLSLVSRAMYDAVAPVRYLSVSLIGNEQLANFAARLTALVNPPVIRHLFIADLHVDGNWYTNDRYLLWIEKRLRSVIASSAPNLVTLTIHDWIFNLAIDDVVFPSLHDLTISSSNPPRAQGEENINLHFPSLRRLHILPQVSRDVYGSPTVRNTTTRDSQLWLDIPSYASCITHLRLSNTTVDGYFVQFLRAILNIPLDASEPFHPKDIRQAHAVASQLSALRYIFLQAQRAPQPLCYQCSTLIPNRVQEELVAVCEVTMHGANSGNTKLMLLPEPSWSLGYDYHDAHRDWQSAIEGTDGPWASPSGKLEDSVSPVVCERLANPVAPHYFPPRYSPSGSSSPTVLLCRTVPPGPPVLAGLDQPPTEGAHQQLSQLAFSFLSLQDSIVRGNQVHRLNRRLASETSARDLCLSLQLIAADPIVHADLQRRVDQHNESIADLERELSAAEGSLRDPDTDVAAAISAFNAAPAPLPEQPPRSSSYSPEIEDLLLARCDNEPFTVGHNLAAESDVVTGQDRALGASQ